VVSASNAEWALCKAKVFVEVNTKKDKEIEGEKYEKNIYNRNISNSVITAN